MDFVQKILQFILDWEQPHEISNPNVNWELLKLKMKGFIVEYTKRKKLKAEAHLKELEDSLKKWHEGKKRWLRWM